MASFAVLRAVVMALLLVAGGCGIRWYVDHIERLDASSMEYIEDSKHGAVQLAAKGCSDTTPVLTAVSCCACTYPACIDCSSLPQHIPDGAKCVLLVMRQPVCPSNPHAASCQPVHALPP
jgi:hypothetical protein